MQVAQLRRLAEQIMYYEWGHDSARGLGVLGVDRVLNPKSTCLGRLSPVACFQLVRLDCLQVWQLPSHAHVRDSHAQKLSVLCSLT